MVKFDWKIIEKAKKAKNIDEIIALAKENGMDITEEEAKEYFDRLNFSGELSDKELDSVAGGACGGGEQPKEFCPRCGTELCHTIDTPAKFEKTIYYVECLACHYKASRVF